MQVEIPLSTQGFRRYTRGIYLNGKPVAIHCIIVISHMLIDQNYALKVMMKIRILFSYFQNITIGLFIPLPY